MAAQHFCKRATLHKLHSHEVRVARLAPVVDAHNVWVVQASNALGLAAKTLYKVRVYGVLGEKNLHSHIAVEQQVARHEHVGHSTAANALVEFVSIVNDDVLRIRHKAL